MASPHKPRLCAVLNLKGGACKTSTVVNIAAALARLVPVLVVDLDPQGSASAWLGHAEGAPDLGQAWGGHRDSLAPRESTIPGVHLVPACADLATASAPDRMAHAVHIAEAIRRTSLGFGVTLLDTPPTANELSLAAYIAADKALIPAEMSALALDGVRVTIDAVQGMNARGYGISMAGILACRVDARSALSRSVQLALRKVYGRQVMASTIRESARVRSAPFQAAAVCHIAPGCGVALDYAAAARELTARLK
jgi:chromosome partitioning protein